jgi:hypothetical protein
MLCIWYHVKLWPACIFYYLITHILYRTVQRMVKPKSKQNMHNIGYKCSNTTWPTNMTDMLSTYVSAALVQRDCEGVVVVMIIW